MRLGRLGDAEPLHEVIEGIGAAADLHLAGTARLAQAFAAMQDAKKIQQVRLDGEIHVEAHVGVAEIDLAIAQDHPPLPQLVVATRHIAEAEMEHHVLATRRFAQQSIAHRPHQMRDITVFRIDIRHTPVGAPIAQQVDQRAQGFSADSSQATIAAISSTATKRPRGILDSI